MTQKISTPLLIIFSAPNLAVGVMITALSVVIPAFYAKYTAAGLAAIGSALFAIRLIEALLDPLAGYLSDNTRSPLGPRKPWMLAGALLAPIAVFFLFNPPAGAGILYFFLGYQALIVAGWAAVIIPYRAWAVELSRDYQERSRIFTYMGIAYGLGATLFALIPFLPTGDSEISPRNLSYIGLALMIAFPLLTLTAVAIVPVGQASGSAATTPRECLQSLAGNRPLQWFLAVFICGGIGQGMVLACFFFFIDSHLRLGEYFSLGLLAVYLTAILAMPVWLVLMKRLGKHRVWALGWAGAALLGICMAFIPKGEAGLAMLMVVIGLYGVCSSVESFAPYSVLGDIVDYEVLKSGINRAGNFNAITAFGGKVNIAIGGALAFLLLDLFHYDVTGNQNGVWQERGFLLTFVWIPVLLYSLSAYFIWRFPLDRRRHDIIRRRLQQKDQPPRECSVCRERQDAGSG